MNTQSPAEVRRARYAKRAELGLCAKFGCSAKRQGGVYCLKHAEQYRQLGEKARRKQGAREGVTGRPPVDVSDPIAQARRERHRKSALESYYRRRYDDNGTDQGVTEPVA